MKRIIWILIAALAAFAALGFFSKPAHGAEKAVCPVCRTMKGETEAEARKATRTYEGATHGFCSDKCAKEFDADPVAFLPPAFPRPAPALGVTTLAGDTLDWSALKGKVVLVDFWATWCKPCHRAMPGLQALHDEYGDLGFSVVGLSIDGDGSQAEVEKFIREKRITYPIVLDSPRNSAWARYRVKAVPAAFLIDGEGQIVAQWLGLPADREEVEGAIRTHLGLQD